MKPLTVTIANTPNGGEVASLPLTIVEPAGDDRAVESAFLAILARRHPGASWEITDRRVAA